MHDRLVEEPPMPMEKALRLAAHHVIEMALGVGDLGLLGVSGARPGIGIGTGLAYGMATTEFLGRHLGSYGYTILAPKPIWRD